MTGLMNPNETGTGLNRLAKIIAHSGLCSRRDAEKMILEGRVSVHGSVVTDPATSAATE